MDDVAFEQQYANRLVAEAKSAFRSWAHWQAINERMGPNELTELLEAYTDDGLGAVRLALSRDGLLGAFRLSDSPQKSQGSGERVTLCRAVKKLEDQSLQALVSDRDWVLQLGYQSIIVDQVVEENKRRIHRICRSLVADWGGKTKPVDPELLALRTELRPVRDRVLAHVIVGLETERAIVSQIDRLVELTLELATDYALLLDRRAVRAEDAKRHLREEAKKFWNFAFGSMLASAQRDS